MQSKVDVTFWSALGDLKLHRLKLEEGPEPLRASWTPSNHAELPGFLTVSAASLPGAAQEAGAAAAAGFEAVGDLYLLNTEERMLKFDRKAAVGQVRRCTISKSLPGWPLQLCSVTPNQALRRFPV